ncbi:MAG TPA: SRPBCC family protein [Chitinophagaceae bacterium]|nr:SRPBCC family protein [Chitinophagaceae bacterium]
MPEISLTTMIHAPAERVFDLSRSVRVHQDSMAEQGEKAVAGKVFGLLDLDDTVTWKARHLRKERVLMIRISSMNRPFYFRDEMIRGDFKSMQHEHFFKTISNGTIMIDVMRFVTPYGRLGEWLNNIYLTGYLRGLIIRRNLLIKSYAEGSRWSIILG